MDIHQQCLPGDSLAKYSSTLLTIVDDQLRQDYGETAIAYDDSVDEVNWWELAPVNGRLVAEVDWRPAVATIGVVRWAGVVTQHPTEAGRQYPVDSIVPTLDKRAVATIEMLALGQVGWFGLYRFKSNQFDTMAGDALVRSVNLYRSER